jgi:hypothetical protein
MNNWNLIRAAGIGAYLMLWASVTWGLISSTEIFRWKATKATSVALHQAFSTSGLLLLGVHLYFLLKDKFLPFTWLDLVVPMRSTYRPIAVTLGIAALFMMLLGVLSTSWGRKVIGTKWWRRSHALAIPTFALTLLHGLLAGSDTRRPAMWWMYVFTACVVLFLLLVRAFTAEERRKRAAEVTLEEEVPATVVKTKRRLTPLAVRPTPVEMVMEQPAAAPPMFWVDDPMDDPSEMTESALVSLAPRRGPTRGEPVLEKPASRMRLGLRRGHVPLTRPKNRSPDGFDF